MRAVILISGHGSNLQSLIDNADKINLEICSVISNNRDAFGLRRAEVANIESHFVNPSLFDSKDDFDRVKNSIKNCFIIIDQKVKKSQNIYEIIK